MEKDYQTEVSNVLIIGAGISGLRAAIAAREAGAEVNILGKRAKRDAHSVLAAGGINGVLGTVDPEDSWEQHFVDTYKEGYFLGDPEAVEILCKEAPERILELKEWGCPFAMKKGKLDQRFFGAHKYRRTCYAGDWTGKAMLHTLADKAESLGLQILENLYVWTLLVEGGRCFGAFAFDLDTGGKTLFLADSVILATGGHTRLWERSSSRALENTGDGIYLAAQAGVDLSDMEMVQFHPTGMTHPEEWIGFLVTESARGIGGKLYNKKGERFMENYDPEKMELSTRDRVALANYTEIMEGRGGEHGGVFLDVTELGKEKIVEQIPRVYRQFLDAQLLDISKEKMEVAPTAHYTMGGIIVEPANHKTSVHGLFAVGETTSGVHGANRLGGNSLAETMVFGKRVGEAAAAYSKELPSQTRSKAALEGALGIFEGEVREGEEFGKKLVQEIRKMLWEKCGVVRDEKRLNEGLAELEKIEKTSKKIDVRPTSEGYQELAVAFDLKAAIFSARATLQSALFRKESRGAHQRRDFPELNPELRKNIVVHVDSSGELKLHRRDVKPLRPDLKKRLDREGEIDQEGKLLE